MGEPGALNATCAKINFLRSEKSSVTKFPYLLSKITITEVKEVIETFNCVKMPQISLPDVPIRQQNSVSFHLQSEVFENDRIIEM